MRGLREGCRCTLNDRYVRERQRRDIVRKLHISIALAANSSRLILAAPKSIREQL